MKPIVAALLSWLALCGMQSPPKGRPPEPPIELYRLDCGTIDVDLAAFSDTGLYAGEKRTLMASCYLIRSGAGIMLWDTGLNGALAGQPKDKNGNLLKEKIADQLARIFIKPTDVTHVGLSHYHFDHVGQVADFPDATLLPGKKDWEVIKASTTAEPRFRRWLSGGGKVEPVSGDKDVFGDGKVKILAMPGHTEGHQALLVQLASGPVLISGDQFHFTRNRSVGGVPSFNVNRAETLASHDRFEKLAANLKAKVIIQHEPDDVGKLPAFPQSAR